MTDRQPPSAERVKAEAYALGFDLAGIASLGPMETAGAFRGWLDRGFAGEMAYLERGAEARADSRRPFPAARSAIVVALDYGGRQPPGPIARYARGRDYHRVMGARLRALHHWLEQESGSPIAAKTYVDTGPLLERDLARRAGLGWFGKNTNLINPRRGSFLLLGTLLVDLELEPDAPFEADRCGTCRRCIDACPTDALVEPRVLDATRCISYLTIELRQAIPSELRPGLGTLVFGCDICQDVCPWNVRFSREATNSDLQPRPNATDPDLRALLALDEAAFLHRFAGTPVMRARRRGLARNAAVALGNRHDPEDVPTLCEALFHEADALVRGHVAWALGRYPDDERARTALKRAAASEPDPAAREEIALACESKGPRETTPSES